MQTQRPPSLEPRHDGGSRRGADKLGAPRGAIVVDVKMIVLSEFEEAEMGVTLHRCGTPWKFGPCWRVQKALDDQGIRYEVVAGPWRPKNRTVVLEGTGQPLYPAIQFGDGSWYRDESKEMASTIGEGRLLDKGQGRGRKHVDTRLSPV